VDEKVAQQEAHMSTFQQQLTDKEMEYKIAEKQNLRALKELQTRVRQLQGEGLTRTNSSNNLSLPNSPMGAAVTAPASLPRSPSTNNLSTSISTPTRKVHPLLSFLPFNTNNRFRAMIQWPHRAFYKRTLSQWEFVLVSCQRRTSN